MTITFVLRFSKVMQSPPSKGRIWNTFIDFIVAREASLVVDGIKHDCFSVDRKSFPVKAPKCTEGN